MNIDEFRKTIIDDLDLEPAFFVGGFGGAILEKERIENATPEELINIARSYGYEVHVVKDSPKQKNKNPWE